MLFIILTFCLYTVSASKFDTLKATSTVTFTEWLSLIVSRGIYSVIIVMIILCVIITAYNKKKTGGRRRNELDKTRKSILSDETDDSSNWITNLWKGPQMFTFQGNDLFNRQRQNSLIEISEIDNDVESLKDKVKEAEVAITALQEELDIAKKARLDLECTMENLERDKSSTDEELRKIKLNTSLELEKMKKETNILQRQLAQAQVEKSQLYKDVEAVARENRITDSALRDQQNLSLRLDEAKSEIKHLREMMEKMKQERDSAIQIASELVTKTREVTKDQTEKRKLIRGFLETNRKLSTIVNNSPIWDVQENDWNVGGDAVSSNVRSATDYEQVEDEEHGEQRSMDNSSNEDLSSGLVTNSPEFRNFLQATFRLGSLGEQRK